MADANWKYPYFRVFRVVALAVVRLNLLVWREGCVNQFRAAIFQDGGRLRLVKCKLKRDGVNASGSYDQGPWLQSLVWILLHATSNRYNYCERL
jgi:hypothetical protein